MRPAAICFTSHLFHLPFHSGPSAGEYLLKDRIFTTFDHPDGKGKAFVRAYIRYQNLYAMKQLILTLLLALFCLPGTQAQTVNSSAQNKQQLRMDRREDREKQRAVRTADYVRYMDSLLLSHNFSFIPQNFQRQPAGQFHQIFNPNFMLGIYTGWVDLYLPYVTGSFPPYQITVLNYSLPNSSVQDYKAVQGNGDWTITFSSQLFSAYTYNFTLNVTTATGGATLTIASDMFNTVVYSGQITAYR